jgi:hypothetical protein
MEGISSEQGEEPSSTGNPIVDAITDEASDLLYTHDFARALIEAQNMKRAGKFLGLDDIT